MYTLIVPNLIERTLILNVLIEAITDMKFDSEEDQNDFQIQDTDFYRNIINKQLFEMSLSENKLNEDQPWSILYCYDCLERYQEFRK